MKSKRPQRKTKRENRRFKKKLFLQILLGIVLVVGFFYVMNHEYLRVHSIKVDGQKTLIDTDIVEHVETYLSQSIAGLIPRDNVLFLNTEKVSKIVQEAFPRINSLSVDLQKQDTLLITLGEKAAHSLWCIDKKYESEFDEECYFADETGLLYAQAPYFSGSTYLKLFIPEQEESTYINSRFLDILAFEEYFDFISSLEQEGNLRIGSIYFRDFSDVDIYLKRIDDAVFDDPFPVLKYNQETPFDIVLRNIDIILGFNSFKKDFNSRPNDLESIDVRFDGRGLYTFTPIDSDSE